MDGVVRRPVKAGNETKPPKSDKNNVQPEAPVVEAAVAEAPVVPVGVPEAVATDASHDIIEIDQQELDQPARRRWWHRLSRRQWAASVSAVVLVAVGVAGIKVVLASQKIASGGGGAPSLQGEIDPTKLKGEGDGRINILLLGVGGKEHEGGKLSDTIMVASIDPVNKSIAMLSIPRDLYVRIPGYGYSKINSANSYGGPDLAKQTVSEILDLPIHYYVQADFNGFKSAVDAVGGLNIANKTSLYDPQYPCDNGNGYCAFKLAPGQYQMDGDLALKYARCRQGACGNDFGRAERQQQLLVALRQKALDSSTLTNPVKMSRLVDSAGDNVRTDFTMNEIKKLATVIKEVDIAKATNRVLDNGPSGLLVDGSGRFAGAGSVLVPKAGAFNYSEIQELAHSLFIDAYLKKEGAKVEVRNATGRNGMAAVISKQLRAYNYNVISASSSPVASKTQIIDYSGGKKPYTLMYLEKRFKAKAQRPPAAGSPQQTGQTQQTVPDIAIIVGSDYKPTNSNQ